jgi:proline racemase
MFTSRSSVADSPAVCSTAPAGRAAVVREITGRPWITGIGRCLLDPGDPFPRGFRIG